MEDFFVRILKLGSFIGRQLISFIEDFLFGLSYDCEFPSSRCHEQSFGKEDQSSGDESSVWPTDIETIELLLDEGNTRSLSPCELSRHENCGLVGACCIETCILKGLMFPLYGIQFGCRLASSCIRYFWLFIQSIQVKFIGFLSRIEVTIRGSSDDIGWMQRTEGLPPVEDGTSRFLEVLHDIRNGKHCLPHSLVYLLIPGLFSNHSPLYFVNTRKYFSKMALTSHIAKIHSEASVERNAWELKQYIEELYWGAGKKVMLLGHSKGGIDAAAALSLYWNDLKDKVAGLALVQSPYGGTPIASDLLREGQIINKEFRMFMDFIVCKIMKGDMRALEDLTYVKRQEFIINHPLPADQIPLLSFHTEASLAPGMLATMCLIAHAELPWFPLPSFFFPLGEVTEEGKRRVPVVVPAAATMGLYALHMKMRYGESSDGMVTRCDAEVPGSIVVRPARKLDHAWMVYTSMKRYDDFTIDGADSSEMCEALLTMLVEVWRKKAEDAVV